MGFSRDVCSYARLDIGGAATEGGAIPGGLPRPDFLLCCNNICGTVVKWYEELARFFDVPMVLMDTPFIHGDKPEHATEYVRQQCLELVKFLERQTGKEFTLDRFASCAAFGTGSRLWKAYQDSREQALTVHVLDAFATWRPSSPARDPGDRYTPSREMEGASAGIGPSDEVPSRRTTYQWFAMRPGQRVRQQPAWWRPHGLGVDARLTTR
jgi:hypothetical protein